MYPLSWCPALPLHLQGPQHSSLPVKGPPRLINTQRLMQQWESSLSRDSPIESKNGEVGGALVKTGAGVALGYLSLPCFPHL